MADINMNYSIDEENKDSVLIRMQKDLNFYLNNLNHTNVSQLYTDYCNIQSEDGTTILDGSLLKMYKSGSSTLRLKMGYNNSTSNFEFVLYDKNGSATIYLDSNGKAVFNGILATTISASSITTGTLSGLSISGNTISGNTISGNTISGNTISGGSLSIGGRFTVNSNGYMSCTGATISGTLSSSTINSSSIYGAYISGGTISGGTISGGSINIGSNFYVSSSGYMTAYGGNFYGTLKTGSGSSYSELSSSGLKNYRSGSLHGLITGYGISDVDFYDSGRNYLSISSSTSGRCVLYMNGYGTLIEGYGTTKIFDYGVDFSNCYNITGLTTDSLIYDGTYAGHNHGIPNGTSLATSGGGSVTWVTSGGHYHSVG